MPDNSTNTLLQDFMQPTAPKDLGSTPAPTLPEIELDQPTPAINTNADFENDDDNDDDDKGKGKKIGEAKQAMLSPETQAEIYIGVVDTTQTLLFSGINRRKMKRRLGDKLQEAEQLFNEIERGALKPTDLSPEQYATFLRIKNMMDVLEAIPFTNDEYEKIKPPLAKIISESGYDLPPSMALVLLGLEIMGPRITDAIFE